MLNQVTSNFHVEKNFSKLPESIRSFGTNSAGLAKLAEYVARFNAAFIDAMNAYSQTRPDLRIVSVDGVSKLNEVLANPAQYGIDLDYNESAVESRSQMVREEFFLC